MFKSLQLSTRCSMFSALFGAARAKPRPSCAAPAKLQSPLGLSRSDAHRARTPEGPLDGRRGRRYPNALHWSSTSAVFRTGFTQEPRELSPLDADEMTFVPEGLQGRDEWA